MKLIIISTTQSQMKNYLGEPKIYKQLLDEYKINVFGMDYYLSKNIEYIKIHIQVNILIKYYFYRALSSVRQSASLTRKKSQVQIL